MSEVPIEQLAAAIEKQFRVRARHTQSVAIEEAHDGKLVWCGTVHVFAVDHPDADTAYAWAASIDGSTKRRFYTVLGKPPISSAADAVRAAIVAEHKQGHS